MLEIVQYSHSHKEVFIQLNQDWMEEFHLEDPKDPMLIDPKKSILDHGGEILMAKSDDQFIGSVALINFNPESYEIAKLSVRKDCRGKGIGKTLLEEAINLARTNGKAALSLESSTKLETALKLYRSMGFKEIEKNSINQCDVRMHLKL